MSDNQIFIHPFQSACLGQGPFKFLKIQENLYYPCKDISGRIDPSVPPVPGGCCAYCGQGIRYECVIEDANGKTFTVGTDCVHKTYKGKMVSDVVHAKSELMKKKKSAKKALEREERLAKERIKNKGLTNSELYELQLEADRKRIAEIYAEKGKRFSVYADQLEDGKGGFRDAIAADLRIGKVPVGRGLQITLDIMAKQAGRANTNAYVNRWNEIETALTKKTEE